MDCKTVKTISNFHLHLLWHSTSLPNYFPMIVNILRFLDAFNNNFPSRYLFISSAQHNPAHTNHCIVKLSFCIVQYFFAPSGAQGMAISICLSLQSYFEYSTQSIGLRSLNCSLSSALSYFSLSLSQLSLFTDRQSLNTSSCSTLCVHILFRYTYGKF